MNRGHLGIIVVWSIFVIVSVNIMNIPLKDCNNLMNDQDGSGKAQCLNHHQEYENGIHIQLAIILAITGFAFPGITTIKCLLYIEEDKKQKLHQKKVYDFMHDGTESPFKTLPKGFNDENAQRSRT